MFHFSMCSYPVCAAPFAEDTVFSPVYIFIFAFLLKNQVLQLSDLCLGFPFNSVNQYVCFYDRTMMI